MHIHEIRKRWINSADKDLNASMQMWDSVSKDYKSKPIPDWKSNSFLKRLDESIDFSQGMSALDIGCGAGGYAIAMADKFEKVVGVDLSPNMIRFAREKAKEHQVNNVEFICRDWNEFDVKSENFNKRFDLVFAHMTPGINSAATLEKLIACSKKYCFMAKPTRRKDSVMDEVKRLADLNAIDNSFDEGLIYAFDMLWQLGYCPKFSYNDEVWEPEKSLEESYAWYIGRVKTYKDINEIEEARLKEYLDSIAVNGIIYETITSTKVTMYWEVS